MKNFAKIEDVQYMEGLKHNILNINQLCNNGLEVVFKSNLCEVKQSSYRKTLKMIAL